MTPVAPSSPGARVPSLPARWNLAMVAATALSLSIGWGIRGNFGHEFGAMIPGALAAMAAVILSGRADWWSRIAHFAFFGALGWSFGGSISYMQVIGYTHSGDSVSVLYGFACLFVIGFLWAAMGGAGTALPALLSREKLSAFYAPLAWVFAAWCLQGFVEDRWVAVDPDYRHRSPLYWYDTDWLAALTAVVVVSTRALVRRRLDDASALILHMAVGWWAGFLGLVILLGWRMTPPRGDNWAGCVGMVAGLWLFLARRRWNGALFVSLLSGWVGGLGFAAAAMFKLIEVKSGWSANWHSVLEQTYGLINGLGVAVAMICLAKRQPPPEEQGTAHAWTDPAAVLSVLLGITYLNLSKNPAAWVKAQAVPTEMYGWSALSWFNLTYLVAAAGMLWLIRRHRQRRLALVPASPLGRAQAFYVVFLWWMVIGNFERAVTSFTAQRLITEGVIFLNAVLATLLVLSHPGGSAATRADTAGDYGDWLRRTAWLGLAGFVAAVFVTWGTVRAVWGNQFAGHASLHIRFGTNATATKIEPPPSLPHP